ncbi:poly [ADP-ribose] polymerase 14-like [Silurus asotus]|uniref:Poly [ADP-ribose] polymerase n=1 Tax=Silurus asotus TaxID=30991 RepID=A0AAD5B033_SILAS|nr:poly [ADP-ribose] polymerase 14-like [Silurus asotus]
MSGYQHPVFFEANNLSDGDIKKIRNYFTIRRQSGGGECGEVEKVGDNTYKISFSEKTAQTRVLSKPEHTINLTGRENLHILIKQHDTQEEKQLLPHSTSDPPDAASLNMHTASGNRLMQKVLELDPYLLRYLKDNSIAKSDLEDQLSSLLSTFQLDIVTETVVVVRDAVQTVQTGQTDVQQKWEAKVDIVFSELQDRYIIRFEVDPVRLEILQKNSCLFPQNLGIYEECGLYVIVGEKKEVDIFVKVIDNLLMMQQAHKECHVSETRYALVKEKYEQEIKSKFSIIQIRQAHPGCLVLKGPEEQINSAATKLQEMLNHIQEKRISLPHPLKAFLSSSGAIQVFQTRFRQNLCSEVLFDDTGSSLDLVLLSLSTGALQEAANAIQRDLCVETVLLEQAQSVSPAIDNLKNALSPALQQANKGSSKVELSYKSGSLSDSGMKVELVGYSNEVNKLKNIIQEYKQNYMEYSDSVSLPSVELVDKFSELLSLLPVTATDVNLTPKSSPHACVQISGPRCKVADMKKKLQSSFCQLIMRKISVDGPGVLQFFQEEGLKTQALLQSSCQVLIFPQNNVQTSTATAGNTVFTSFPTLPTYVSPSVHPVALEIIFGGLENQQADILVAPMLNTNLKSTIVGKSLLDKGGQHFQSNFDAAKGRCRITPGDVLEVDGTPLGCDKVFFIECAPWTGNTHNSEKALRSGLKRALALCELHACSLVAFPVIGPGVALAVPIKNAVDILTGEIRTFSLSQSTGSLRAIRIVIMPNYPDSEEIYWAVNTGLNAIMVDHTGQATFQSLSSEIDDVTIPVSTCQLRIIFGDISNETTDVIVNTTDFTDLQTDVCNDILTIAGPQVRAAINRGKGGLNARLVAQAILQGVKDATIQANFNSVQRIHIVLMKIHVFLEFKTMAQQIFGQFNQRTAPLLYRPHRASTSSLSLSLSSLVPSLPDQHDSADFLVVGLTDDNVSKACRELLQAYKSHCSSHVVSQEELKHFSPAEVDNLINNVRRLGIQISQRGPDGLEVHGLTKGVNKFIEQIKGALLRQMREKEQDIVFSHVSWCILGLRGIWERLPKEAHHQLENNIVGGGILDAQAQKWTVNRTIMEAKAKGSNAVTKLKRLENLPDFNLPLYWDSMNAGDVKKVVKLHPSSAEYKKVKNDFKRTVAKAVVKIERIQNMHLRRAYEVRKKELQNKNGVIGAGEKVLYHGTTADACDSIMHSNFNRRFAGQNATMYGLGTYFALNASYSANPTYSVPATDGTQLMFVTLVLTGHYTQGQRDMIVPPPRSSQDPNDRFDSVVDNMQNPSMFVVFHDCQAYPDYLITFK